MVAPVLRTRYGDISRFDFRISRFTRKVICIAKYKLWQQKHPLSNEYNLIGESEWKDLSGNRLDDLIRLRVFFRDSQESIKDLQEELSVSKQNISLLKDKILELTMALEKLKAETPSSTASSGRGESSLIWPNIPVVDLGLGKSRGSAGGFATFNPSSVEFGSGVVGPDGGFGFYPENPTQTLNIPVTREDASTVLDAGGGSGGTARNESTKGSNACGGSGSSNIHATGAGSTNTYAIGGGGGKSECDTSNNTLYTTR